MLSALPTGSSPAPVTMSDRPAPASPKTNRVYSTIFWASYVANVTAVTANGLTYRFAELVGFLGGNEQKVGLIVGVAVAIALGARLFLGQAIDRYGVRRLWLISAVLFSIGGLLLAVTHDLSWLLYAARSLFAVGLAGMLTCSTVHIQTLVPAERRTEIIASLGSSGFVGMILGAILGDLIFATLDGFTRYAVLFGSAGLLGALYVGFVHWITRSDRHRRPRVTPALHHLLIRYWPGNVLLVAFIMGMMVAVTTVFLTRFATYHGMDGIGTFFMGYAVSAFFFRVTSRGWSRTVGRHRMILMGLAGHTAAMLLLPIATTPLLFAVPAVFGGFGHALLFPAVVSLGSEAFPRKFRGTGTTVVMGFFDVGTVVSAPILGTIIDYFDGTGFTAMFLFSAFTSTLVAVIYQFTTAKTVDTDLAPAPPSRAVKIRPHAVGMATIFARHSPIEPAPPGKLMVEEAGVASAAQPVSRDIPRESSFGEPPSEMVVVRAEENSRPREGGVRISPVTRCR